MKEGQTCESKLHKVGHMSRTWPKFFYLVPPILVLKLVFLNICGTTWGMYARVLPIPPLLIDLHIKSNIFKYVWLQQDS